MQELELVLKSLKVMGEHGKEMFIWYLALTLGLEFLTHVFVLAFFATCAFWIKTGVCAELVRHHEKDTLGEYKDRAITLLREVSTNMHPTAEEWDEAVGVLEKYYKERK